MDTRLFINPVDYLFWGYLPTHEPRQVYTFTTILVTSIMGNLSVQVGVPPGVGSGYGHFEVLGVGSESA